MKYVLSILVKLSILGISLMALVACQDEIEPEIAIGMDGIASEDPVASSIVAVASKDGSEDNIIDQSSCTTVRFPITGIFEDGERIFESLEEVEALGAGALEIDWIFPLSVILFNHTEVILNSEDELEAIQDECIEGGNDVDNECVDFSYPFVVQVFDTRTENVDTREITSDRVAYITFTSSELITTITYPIDIVNVAGDTIQTFSNEELVSLLAAAASGCDEQDIIEFEEIFEGELRMLFASSNWRVSFYEEDGSESTVLFSGYTLQFNENLTLQSQGVEVVDGEWEIELDDGESVSIAFDTEDPPLELLNETWIIADRNQTQMTLEYQVVGESTKRLRLSSD